MAVLHSRMAYRMPYTQDNRHHYTVPPTRDSSKCRLNAGTMMTAHALIPPERNAGSLIEGASRSRASIEDCRPISKPVSAREQGREGK